MEPQFISTAISFAVGLLVGGSLGAAAMALVSFNRADDDEDLEDESLAATERRP